MKIIITEPCIFRGAHTPAGTTLPADISAQEESEILASGKAIRDRSEAPPAARETAALRPRTETATIGSPITNPKSPVTGSASAATITVAEDTGSGFERLVDVPQPASPPPKKRRSRGHKSS